MNLTTTLRAKIILIVCGVAASVALLVGGLNYLRTEERALKSAIDGLAGETRLMASRFVSVYNEMENDAFVVSQTPPIDGLERSLANNGIDPMDQSTTEQWRARLETIFIFVMRSREHYTQMRYIGIEDNGREMVRVNRTKSGFERVAEGNLQQKAGEPYFKDSLSLKEGEVYFSDVTYNREEGQLDDTLLPTVRTVVPLFRENALIGFIVINADYPKLLTQILEEIKPDKNTFIVSQSGDYMEFHPESGAGSFTFLNTAKHIPPFVQATMTTVQQERYFIEEPFVDYLVRLNVSEYNPDAFVGVVLRVKKDDLLQAAYETRRETIMLGAALVLLSLMLALVVSRRLSAPLVTMARNIKNIGEDRQVDLPIQMQDEVGELARAFEKVFNEISASEVERDRLIAALEDSNAELEEFAYRTSHDLRSPLVSSIGLLDAVSKAIENDKKDVAQQGLSHANTSLKKLENLVNDILTLTKTKKIEEEMEPLNVEDMVREAIEKMSHMENADRLTFNTHLHVPTVSSRKNRLVLMVENLISNAIKYQDTAKSHSFVTITTQMEDDWFVLSVEDNGIGIPKERQPDVFTMFKRFHPQTAFGSGLGMYMMKKSVQILGGTIHYEDTGDGSKFSIKLPPADEAKQHTPNTIAS